MPTVKTSTSGAKRKHSDEEVEDDTASYTIIAQFSFQLPPKGNPALLDALVPAVSGYCRLPAHAINPNTFIAASQNIVHHILGLGITADFESGISEDIPEGFGDEVDQCFQARRDPWAAMRVSWNVRSVKILGRHGKAIDKVVLTATLRPRLVKPLKLGFSTNKGKVRFATLDADLNDGMTFTSITRQLKRIDPWKPAATITIPDDPAPSAGSALITYDLTGGDSPPRSGQPTGTGATITAPKPPLASFKQGGFPTFKRSQFIDDIDSDSDVRGPTFKYPPACKQPASLGKGPAQAEGSKSGPPTSLVPTIKDFKESCRACKSAETSHDVINDAEPVPMEVSKFKGRDHHEADSDSDEPLSARHSTNPVQHIQKSAHNENRPQGKLRRINRATTVSDSSSESDSDTPLSKRRRLGSTNKSKIFDSQRAKPAIRRVNKTPLAFFARRKFGKTTARASSLAPPRVAHASRNVPSTPELAPGSAAGDPLSSPAVATSPTTPPSQLSGSPIYLNATSPVTPSTSVTQTPTEATGSSPPFRVWIPPDDQACNDNDGVSTAHFDGSPLAAKSTTSVMCATRAPSTPTERSSIKSSDPIAPRKPRHVSNPDIKGIERNLIDAFRACKTNNVPSSIDNVPPSIDNEAMDVDDPPSDSDKLAQCEDVGDGHAATVQIPCPDSPSSRLSVRAGLTVFGVAGVAGAAYAGCSNGWWSGAAEWLAQLRLSATS